MSAIQEDGQFIKDGHQRPSVAKLEFLHFLFSDVCFILTSHKFHLTLYEIIFFTSVKKFPKYSEKTIRKPIGQLYESPTRIRETFFRDTINDTTS